MRLEIAPSSSSLQALGEEYRTATDDVPAVLQRRRRAAEQTLELLLSLEQWAAGHFDAIEVQQVEQVEHEVAGRAGIGCRLHSRKGRDAVRPHRAKLAVEIGLFHAKPAKGSDGRRIFVAPIEPRPGQQSDAFAVDPRMHAIAVVLDLMRPAIALRRLFDELTELGFDEGREVSAWHERRMTSLRTCGKPLSRGPSARRPEPIAPVAGVLPRVSAHSP
jgi:hypothetical protein